ncbi:MAG TPA: PIN domain-containing protein [Chloroflexota bacterium]|nr:PIN domain-containing protein [Chloroflexota bacterium]
MAAVVVDTDVVSFLFRHDSRAELYRPHLAGRLLVVSFMAVAELEVWMLQHAWGRARRTRLESYLEGYVMYSAHRALCRTWAAVVTAGRRLGRPIQSADAWIAATALVQNIPLVTHNARDYSAVAGLTIISESPA